MKDDKWICHVGKEITLSLYDRLAWFVCASVPESLDGDAKRARFQDQLTSHLILHRLSGGSGASSLDFLVPNNLSVKGESSAHGARHKASVRVKVNTLVEHGALGWYKSWPISSHHTENHCSLHSNTHWEASLWHDMGLPQNSICYLNSVPWSVQWGCFSLNSKQIANVFSFRSPTVPILLNLKWFFAKLVRLQQNS